MEWRRTSSRAAGATTHGLEGVEGGGEAGDHRTGLIGPYEILREIGRGAFGRVFLVRHGRTRAHFALKRMRRSALGSDVLRRRFVREVSASETLSHPGLVRCVAHELAARAPFYVMELVRGPSVRDLLDGGGVAKQESAPGLLARMAQLCDALQHAHDRGYVHRDIKPSNILVDDTGRLRLIDFGVASDEASAVDLTRGMAGLGTPRYMSPEQVDPRRGPVDPRTDVYGVCAVLYELLTGQPARPEVALYALLTAICDESPIDPRTLVPGISPALSAAVMRGLAARPEERFPSAAALRAALLQCAAETEPAV